MDTVATPAVLAILAGASGAALIKLLDNVIMWFLGRRAKKQDDKVKSDMSRENRKSELEKKVDAIADCVAILSIDRLQNCCKQCIHDGEISLADRQRIHAMYAKAHAIGVNGDLKDLLRMIDELKLIDPLNDGANRVFEEGETHK